jgi:glutamate carboxypeptidase
MMQEWMPAFRSDLTWLVSQDRGYMFKPGVDAAVEWMHGRLEELGCDTQLFPSTDTGNAVAGTLTGHGRGRYLLLAHLDTVWPQGTAAEWPLCIEGDKASGPGAWDNGTGCLTGYYVLRAQQHIDPAAYGEVTLLCNGDEESGSRFSGEIIRRLARQHDAAFCLEAPTDPHEIIGQRAGSMGCEMHVRGERAHSQTPGAGINAILELSHKIVAAHEIRRGRSGVWVQAVTTEGGIQSGSVPNEAQALFDISFNEMKDVAWVEARFQEIAERSWVPGSATSMSTILYHPPQERLEGTGRLVELALAIGSALGVELRDTFCTGVADGSFATAEGVPALCGLSASGGGAHTRQEWVDLSQVAPRTALVAGLVLACSAAE